MAEAEASKTKSKTEYFPVTMSDGRVVQFAGKRKVMKETLLDTTKIESDGQVLQLSPGAISVRMDFRNGETRTMPLPLSLVAKFAGHGGEQKFGDELATTADKPLSEDDMVIAIDDLNSVIQKGEWGKGRAEGGGGVSGAGTVVKALMEATGKDLAFIKDWIEKKIAATPGLTRPALYASFRAAGTKTAEIIARLESEKAVKEAKIDANAALAEMQG